MTEVERSQSGGSSVAVPMCNARSALMHGVIENVLTEDERHDAAGAHSRVRFDTANKRMYQLREFDANGVPVRDIDLTKPTFPNGSPRPRHPGPPRSFETWVRENLKTGIIDSSSQGMGVGKTKSLTPTLMQRKRKPTMSFRSWTEAGTITRVLEK